MNSSSTSKKSTRHMSPMRHSYMQMHNGQGVVIEVGFSQTEKDLRDLAEEYILGSDGNIRVMMWRDRVVCRRSARSSQGKTTKRAVGRLPESIGGLGQV
jgi:hypothetical protein